MVARSEGYVYRPSDAAGIQDVFQLSRDTGRRVVPRGSGYSYGDTSTNRQGLVLDLTRMNRVLDWQPDTGFIRLEPGVTIRDLWRYVLEDGWWPAVVPGAMYPTVGGVVAVNAHGKNAWHAGTVGEQVREIEVMLPSGETRVLHPDDELFRAEVGGLGMLGVVTSVSVQLRRVESGDLRVREWAARSLDEMFAVVDERTAQDDYVVGWIDGLARGETLGRGLIQGANYVTDDPEAGRTLRAEYQELPDTIAGIYPRSKLWLLMRPTVNDTGMRYLNALRYVAGSRRAGHETLVPHAQFHFFHDFVPEWKRSFWPGGIVQYQVFVPQARALPVFRQMIARMQEVGVAPYLAVFKRHRTDPFLLSYGVDGYSLSLDFHVTTNNTRGLRETLSCLTDTVVLPAGGRFYPAKDDMLTAVQARQSFGAGAVDRFLELKAQLDPENLLQSDQFGRLFS